MNTDVTTLCIPCKYITVHYSQNMWNGWPVGSRGVVHVFLASVSQSVGSCCYKLVTENKSKGGQKWHSGGAVAQAAAPTM